MSATGLSDNSAPEGQARGKIDEQLVACGWFVQDYRNASVAAVQGFAVREVSTESGADYVLFVDGQVLGVIEAKKAGSTLTGVEFQTRKYRTAYLDELSAFEVGGALPADAAVHSADLLSTRPTRHKAEAGPNDWRGTPNRPPLCLDTDSKYGIAISTPIGGQMQVLLGSDRSQEAVRQHAVGITSPHYRGSFDDRSGAIVETLATKLARRGCEGS